MTDKPKRVYPSRLSKKKYKDMYGGSFPLIVPRKKQRKYPDPSDEKAWMRLIADALNHKNLARHNHQNGLPPPPPNTQYAYVLYHCKPVQKDRRAKRNRHREEIKKETGKNLKGKHVHHKDRKTLKKSSTVVMDNKKHLHMHGKQFSKEAKRKMDKTKNGT